MAQVEIVDEVLTAVAGGPLLERLNLAGAADARELRPIGPRGYTGGERYLDLGGGGAGRRRLPLGPVAAGGRHRAAPWRSCVPVAQILFRFLTGADLGRAQKAAA